MTRILSWGFFWWGISSKSTYLRNSNLRLPLHLWEQSLNNPLADALAPRNTEEYWFIPCCHTLIIMPSVVRSATLVFRCVLFVNVLFIVFRFVMRIFSRLHQADSTLSFQRGALSLSLYLMNQLIIDATPRISRRVTLLLSHHLHDELANDTFLLLLWLVAIFAFCPKIATCTYSYTW